MSASVGIIVLLTLSIVFFTHEEVNSLVFSESSEELQNYSNMGLQLFERSYEGSWSVKEGKLFKGDTQINENYELIDDFTKGTQVLATVFQNDTRIATNVQDESGKRIIPIFVNDDMILRPMAGKRLMDVFLDGTSRLMIGTAPNIKAEKYENLESISGCSR